MGQESFVKSKSLSIYLVGLLFAVTFTVPKVASAANLVDETKPISLYCDSTLYACAGYEASTDEQYLPPWAPDFKNVQGFYHNDLAGIFRFPSYAIAISRDSQGNATSVSTCNDIASSSCVGSEVYFRADLPMCASQVTIDCVRAISATDEQGNQLESIVVGEFPTGNPQYFKGSPTLKVPNGGGATLIRIPKAPHSAGDLYLMKAQMNGSKIQSEQIFSLDGLSVSISAVKLIEGRYTYGGASTNPALYLKGFSSIGSENGTYPSSCAIASPTQCAARYALPMNLRFGLTIELSRKITGWLHGRLKAPEVTVVSNRVGGSTITVSAEPIKVPVNATWVNNDRAPQKIKDYYRNKPNTGSPLFGNENKSKPLSEIALMRDGNTGHNDETLSEYLAWLESLGDKAQALPTAWSLQTMSNYQVSNEIKRCLDQTDSLAGVVTTNAAEYLDGPPTFDAKSGMLDYKVAATHYEPDGKTIFKGTYDLVMSSKVARCIYGFSSAPISATISITSVDVQESVAATKVSEKAGWLTLSAYNFTYSSPTIRVKLTGTPIKLITPTRAKKITCAKGKNIKVLSATKCPTGYKKQS